jgi:hypothetical protein
MNDLPEPQAEKEIICKTCGPIHSAQHFTTINIDCVRYLWEVAGVGYVLIN